MSDVHDIMVDRDLFELALVMVGSQFAETLDIRKAMRQVMKEADQAASVGDNDFFILGGGPGGPITRERGFSAGMVLLWADDDEPVHKS